MIKSRFRARRLAGFTLIELLVVISIIGILAGLLLPALAAAKKAAYKKRAAYEMQGIIAAVNQYDTTYSRMPLSTAGVNSLTLPVPGGCPDFTFGTITTAGAPLLNKSGQPLPAVGNVGNAGNYQEPNSGLMAILMDQITMPDGVTPTVNSNHVKNPQQHHFLDPKMVSDTVSPGVGADLVYRDPWGNPYIVSLDMNADNRVRDGFYRAAAVSRQSGSQGYNGLNNNVQGSAGDDFEANGTVMVWSFGPDSGVDPTQNANTSSNKDNITSW